MTAMHRFQTLTLAVLLLAGCDDDPQRPDPQQEIDELIEVVRAATEPYRNFDVAASVGYEPASPCVENGAGAMGFHYLRPDLVDATVEPTEPELLLYAPDGADLRLVGVEFMVAADPWDAANTAAPELAGHVFDDHRAEDARHGIPFPHYDLHLWAWESNPDGPFAHFNPMVSC